MEPLVAVIRGNDNFPGVTCNGTVEKFMIYADDVLFLISELTIWIPTLFNKIDAFAKLSGYNVNWDMSEVLPLTRDCPTAHLNGRNRG